MSARILNLDRSQRPASAARPTLVGATVDAPARLHFWRGASGKRYVHSVYSLIDCPPVPNASYLLVHRGSDGHRRVLQVAAADADAPTLNLARIRQRGAQLGANEVHVHFPADTRELRHSATCDLRARQFAESKAEPRLTARH